MLLARERGGYQWWFVWLQRLVVRKKVWTIFIKEGWQMKAINRATGEDDEGGKEDD